MKFRKDQSFRDEAGRSMIEIHFLMFLDIFLLPMHVLFVMNSIKLVTCFFQSNYEAYGTNALIGFQLWTLHFSKAELDSKGS